MKVIFFSIIAVVIGFSLFKAFENPGEVVLSWQGYELVTSTAFLLTVLAVLLLSTFWGGQLWTLLTAAPTWLKNKKKWKSQEKAIHQFVEGMEALHLGEEQKAQKIAKGVMKSQPKLGGLLWANMANDSTESQKAIENLSTAETGKVLSLLTLAKQAESAKQWQSMKTLMEQAYTLKPKAPEVVFVMFKALLHTAHFKDAVPFTDKLKFSLYYSAEELDLLTAALCTEVGRLEEDDTQKLKWFKKALEASDVYVPAMMESFKYQQNEKQVVKWLVQCPHQNVFDLWFALQTEVPEKKLVKKSEVLVAQIAKKHADYKTFSKGYLLNLNKKYDEAYMELREATSSLPHTSVYKMLSDLEQKKGGGVQRAKWLEKALDAKPLTLIGEEAMAYEQKFKQMYPVTVQSSLQLETA